MKKVIALLLLFTGLSSGFAQNAKKFTSGDEELDKSMKSITASARTNGESFKAALVARYSLTEEKAKEYYANYTGGDIIMIFETAKESGKSAETVSAAFNKNRSTKGWDATLKDLGIKSGGKSFEAIKSAVVNNGLD